MDTKKDLNYQLYLHREAGFRRMGFQVEFERYYAVQSGDIEQVQKNAAHIKENFMEGKGVLSADPITNIRYHMIIATAMIARVCVEGGLDHDTAYTLSDIYIQRADISHTEDALLSLMGEMLLDFTRHMKELKRYAATSLHVRRCIDYIHEHLNEKLTLEVLAEMIGVNGAYLSKLFVKETGKSLKDFILTAKVHTAENMLRYSELSSMEIALALGFSSQSAFIATFRRISGMTPKQYKMLHYRSNLI